jgi:NAD(P)-dependent dehydrogenase (short-subunit alcohol dehydrogenase family)
MTTAQEAFSGGVAVITGAGSGIGEALAHGAAALGMRVVLADVAGDRIERVAAEIRAAGGSASPMPTDVGDAGAVAALAAAVHERFGDVRLLVNNAGIEVLGYSWDVPPELWERAVRVNLLGAVHGARSFLPRMLASGAPAYLANVSSVGGLSMMAQQAPYIVSKHALLSFTECLALEVEMRARPVRISAVLPGPVATRIFEDAGSGADAASIAQHMSVMRQLLAEQGMAPLEAARAILEGVAAGEFWVSTHPEMTRQMAAARAQHLLNLSTPVLTADMRAITGM